MALLEPSSSWVALSSSSLLVSLIVRSREREREARRRRSVCEDCGESGPNCTWDWVGGEGVLGARLVLVRLGRVGERGRRGFVSSKERMDIIDDGAVED